MPAAGSQQTIIKVVASLADYLLCDNEQEYPDDIDGYEGKPGDRHNPDDRLKSRRDINTPENLVHRQPYSNTKLIPAVSKRARTAIVSG